MQNVPCVLTGLITGRASAPRHTREGQCAAPAITSPLSRLSNEQIRSGLEERGEFRIPLYCDTRVLSPPNRNDRRFGGRPFDSDATPA